MATRLEKRLITENVFLDGVLHRELHQVRTIYADKKGEFVRVMGNKKYLTDNAFEMHIKTMRAYTVQEVLDNILKS